MEVLKLTGVYVVIFMVLTNDISANEAESRLRDMLFPFPDEVPTIPIVNSTQKLDVWIKLYITQIVDVNEKNQVLTTKVWMKQMWYDYHLVWDPDEYGKITNLKVPNAYVWLPDILIYNNADGDYDIKANTWVNIEYTGNVTWFPPAVYKSSCQIDVTWYPFDEQLCKLKFGSWTHDFDVLNLIPDSPEAERKYYWPNGEWMIKGVPAKRNVLKYPCCEELFVDVTYEIALTRKPLFYFVYLLMPCGLLSFNTMLVFYLPPDIGEKMALCINVLVSLALFLLLITTQIPANANSFPLIVKYLIFTLIVVSSSIIVTVYVLNMRFRSSDLHKMPNWVKMFFLCYLPPYILLERPERYTKHYRKAQMKKEDLENEMMHVKRTTEENQGSSYAARMRNEIDAEMHELYTPKRGGANAFPYSTPRSSLRHRDSDAIVVHETLEEIKYITWQYRNEVESSTGREDWKFLAMVIDRIFLIGYLAAIVIGTLVIILQAPLSLTFFKEMIFDTEYYEWYNDPNRSTTIHEYHED